MTTRRRSVTPELAHDSDSASDTSSLVLEDLVRIGEASRLRRRGALRLDTASTSTAVATNADHDTDSLLANLAAAAHSAASPSYRVYCGARDWAHDHAPRPSSLPDDEEQQVLEQPWTGCRALVHAAAAPCERDGTWFAQGPAAGSVVRLSAAFFDRGGRRVRRPCGCASDGVGCCVCGNALGIVYRPCTRHMRLFPNADPDDGDAQPFCVYSFFANATDADPPFAFPPPTVAPPPLNSPVDEVEFGPDDALESPKF